MLCQASHQLRRSAVDIRGASLGPYLLIALVAILPRLLASGTFITYDEANFWMSRSYTFLQALQTGDFAATIVSTHPGVTTVWLGSAGIVLRQLLEHTGVIADPTFALRLSLMQVPVILVHTAGIVVGYALLRQLWPRLVATLAAVLWATDPFLVGYQRILHVDGLAATFVAVSVLAACAYWHHTPRLSWLLLSGGCAGLAILSKSPALVLLPAVGSIALVAHWQPVVALPQQPPGRRSLVGGTLRPLAWWAVACAVTMLLLWPALWANPLAVYQQLRIGVVVEGGSPHALGNVFLGQAVAVPDWRFYPVVVALCTTPWTLAGVLLLPAVVQRLDPPVRRDLLVLVAFVVVFVVAMSVFPKKFNRYLIPAWPLIDLVAALGLVTALAWWRTQRGAWAWRSVAQHSGLVGLALAAVLNVACWHPYELAAFNQLLGGARTGAWAFKAGWGEGMDQAAAWLNAQPDITGVVVASTSTEVLQPYLRPGAQAVSPTTAALPNESGYVVAYIRQVQGGAWPPFDQYQQRQPVHTVRIHGVAYAQIYQVPPDVPHPYAADFGTDVGLRGVAGERHATDQQASLTLLWHMRAPAEPGLMLFVHVFDTDGQRVAQVDLPFPPPAWQASQYFPVAVPLTLPESAGGYAVTVGLYDQTTGERLPVTGRAPADPAMDGPNALLLPPVLPAAGSQQP